MDAGIAGADGTLRKDRYRVLGSSDYRKNLMFAPPLSIFNRHVRHPPSLRGPPVGQSHGLDGYVQRAQSRQDYRDLKVFQVVG